MIFSMNSQLLLKSATTMQVLKFFMKSYKCIVNVNILMLILGIILQEKRE